MANLIRLVTETHATARREPNGLHVRLLRSSDTGFHETKSSGRTVRVR